MAQTTQPPSIPTTPTSSTPSSRRPSRPVPDGSTSGCDKFLVGCGLGCGVLLILGIVAAVGAALWVFRPGTQHETATVVAEESVATLRLEDVGRDQGTQEFLTHAINTFNEANRQIRRENMPENMRWLSDLGNQDANPAGMNMFFPRDLTLSFEERDPEELAAMGNPGTVDDLAIVGAVNFRSFVRPIRMIFEFAAERDETARIRPHGEHRLLGLERNAWICFVDGTLYFSGSPSALEAALDRLDRGEVNRLWTAEIPEGDWDVAGTLEEGSHMIEEILAWSLDPKASLDDLERRAREAEKVAEGDGTETAEDAPADHPLPRLDPRLGDPDEVVGELAFGADIRSADAVTVVFHLELQSAEWAERYAEVLREKWQERADRVAEEGLDLGYDVRVEGSKVVGEADLVGLEGWIERKADELVEESRRREGESTSGA